MCLKRIDLKLKSALIIDYKLKTPLQTPLHQHYHYTTTRARFLPFFDFFSKIDVNFDAPVA